MGVFRACLIVSRPHAIQKGACCTTLLWHPALQRPVYIAVDSSVHLSQVGDFPPFARSSGMQQTRARKVLRRLLGVTATNQTRPLQHRCQQPSSHAIAHWIDPPLSGFSIWNVVPRPLLDRPGVQPAHSGARFRVSQGDWSHRVFSFCFAFFQLRCGRWPPRSHRPSRPAPSPPTPLSGSFAIAFSVVAR